MDATETPKVATETPKAVAEAPKVFVRSDDIRRTTAPATMNGTQWEVQLNTIPTKEWLDLFRVSAGSVNALPQRVVFDRASAFFKSDEEHVEHWIRSLDKWFASTNDRFASKIEQASLERATRENAETKEKERIRQLNERFKDL